MTKEELIDFWANDLARKLELHEIDPEKALDISPIRKTLTIIYNVGYEAGRGDERMKRQLEGEKNE